MPPSRELLYFFNETLNMQLVWEKKYVPEKLSGNYGCTQKLNLKFTLKRKFSHHLATITLMESEYFIDPGGELFLLQLCRVFWSFTTTTAL